MILSALIIIRTGSVNYYVLEAILTCRRDESKDKFPWQGEEVHDVVAAGGHLLLALFALLALLLIVIWVKRV